MFLMGRCAYCDTCHRTHVQVIPREMQLWLDAAVAEEMERKEVLADALIAISDGSLTALFIAVRKARGLQAFCRRQLSARSLSVRA